MKKIVSIISLSFILTVCAQESMGASTEGTDDGQSSSSVGSGQDQSTGSWASWLPSFVWLSGTASAEPEAGAPQGHVGGAEKDSKEESLLREDGQDDAAVWRDDAAAEAEGAPPEADGSTPESASPEAPSFLEWWFRKPAAPAPATATEKSIWNLWGWLRGSAPPPGVSARTMGTSRFASNSVSDSAEEIQRPAPTPQPQGTEGDTVPEVPNVREQSPAAQVWGTDYWFFPSQRPTTAESDANAEVPGQAAEPATEPPVPATERQVPATALSNQESSWFPGVPMLWGSPSPAPAPANQTPAPTPAPTPAQPEAAGESASGPAGSPDEGPEQPLPNSSSAGVEGPGSEVSQPLTA